MNRFVNTSLLVASVMLATSVATSAHAQWYVGATGGTAKTKLNPDGLNVQFLDLGFTSSTTRSDESSAALRAFGGYQFNRYLALEAGYSDLGNVSFGASVVPAGTLEKRTKTTGYDISAVVMYPILDRLNVFARVGAFSSERKSQFTTMGSIELLNGVSADSKQKQNKTTLAAGLTYNVASNIDLRLEYAQYGKYEDELLEGSQKINVYLLGVAYRFK